MEAKTRANWQLKSSYKVKRRRLGVLMPSPVFCCQLRRLQQSETKHCLKNSFCDVTCQRTLEDDNKHVKNSVRSFSFLSLKRFRKILSYSFLLSVTVCTNKAAKAARS
jgi:hypothetical protein